MDLIFGRVARGLFDPTTRARAMSTTRSCRSRDDTCELRKLFGAQYRGTKYVADIWGVDTYQSPQRTREWGGGDCDDHVSKILSEAASIGFRPGARVIATDGRNMSHIMAIVGVPKEEPTRAVVLDTTVPGATVGWQPPKHMRRKWKDYWLEWDEHGRPYAVLAGSSSIWSERPWLMAGLVLAGVATVGGITWYLVKRRAS